MSVRIVCKCSPQALLAKVRGVKDAEKPFYEDALKAVWVADWHHMPNLDWQKGFKDMPLPDDATDEQRKVRAFLSENTQTLTWEVNCPRKECRQTFQGQTEDLVYLVQQALADGVRTLTLDSAVLSEAGKETRSFTVLRSVMPTPVKSSSDAHSGT